MGTPAGCIYGFNADISYVRNPSGQKTSNMSTAISTVTFLKLIILKLTQQMYVNLTLVWGKTGLLSGSTGRFFTKMLLLNW